MSSEPGEQYAAHAAERRASLLKLQNTDRNFAIVRGFLALVAVVAALNAGGGRPAVAIILAVSVVGFLAVLIAHDSVLKRLAKAAARVAFYEGAGRRTQGDWIGHGETGLRFLDPAHPNAIDLDLFGRGSMFERLCVARTHAGQEKLASWLKEPASIAILRERQKAVTELGPRLDLREDLFVLGGESRRAVDSSALLTWVSALPVPIPRGLRVAAFASSVAVLVALLGWALDLWDGAPFRFAFLAVAVCTWRGLSFSREVLHGIGRPVQDLETLKDLFNRLVGERFEAARLVELHATLSSAGEHPAQPILRLKRWMEAHESKSNVFFGVLSFLLVWDLQLACAIENWRRRFGALVATWLSTLGEFEALVSVSTYAFENPTDPFPEFDQSAVCFHAEGVAHPLLPRNRAVANDVSLDLDRQMLVITGSNMSGKSTLLRTVGINTVLALAGAPVRAAKLRVSSLAVGASIRIQDSLQDGESKFYAEIKRVRQILDLAKATPTLFLMDEIFDGTNSAERRVGAEAVVRTLVERGAIGLVTSHDLALADIAGSLAPRATNVHFEDHLEGDRMAFDYRIKEGPVRRGNALGLMRAVGLDV